MTDHPREEIQRAVDRYLGIRETAEREGDWAPLAQMFTEDATFIDPAWGRMRGREAIVNFMRDSMKGLESWTFPVDWIMIEGRRAVIKFRNRLPGCRDDGSFYEASGVQLLEYAGNGQFSFEEDIINMTHVYELITECGWIPGPEVVLPPEGVER